MTDPGDSAAPGAEPTPVASGPIAAPETELRTFLIADIRGYTTYTREHGDEAAASLASRFAELVSEVVTAPDGFLLELRGDEALVVFVSARKALRAAIDLQARFIEAELPRGVGIGLDAGEAIPVGDGYRGTALNLAARLCAEAGPGETLASEAVIHLAAKVDGIAYVDARSLKLKGYVDSVRAVVVVPLAWQCGACRDFETSVVGQLKAIGITVKVIHEEDYPGTALAAGSAVDLLALGSGTDYPDPVSLIGGLHDDVWLGKATLRELQRLQGLSGQARSDGAAALAHRVVDEEALVLPTGYPVYPFVTSARIGCGFVQPAIGAVDLLRLCLK